MRQEVRGFEAAAIRVLVANEHELLRAGIVKLLANCPDINVVAAESCGPELIGKLRTTEMEVLLLEMQMPPPRGADLIARIKRSHPGLRILELGFHDDILLVLRAMRAGASGFISTHCDLKALLDAICKVATTGRYLDPELAEKMAFASTKSGVADIDSLLSNRELQILPLIAEGKCIKTIANELSISDKTVSTHKSHILAKLGLKNTADLVRYAMQHEQSY